MKALLAKIVHLLAGWAGLYVYKYAKSDATATVVVLLENGTKTIVIQRRKWPFQGGWALPGGFLNVALENLRRAAKRELKEETCIDLPEERFIPVDERSEPGRDPRGHVVDHGYLVVIAADETAAVLAQLKASDDAADAKVVPVSELTRRGVAMAFDHQLLLERALAIYNRG
jgi:ADP-ribose pyrophosphatase YjhB (NUDIX family)